MALRLRVASWQWIKIDTRNPKVDMFKICSALSAASSSVESNGAMLPLGRRMPCKRLSENIETKTDLIRFPFACHIPILWRILSFLIFYIFYVFLISLVVACCCYILKPREHMLGRGPLTSSEGQFTACHLTAKEWTVESRDFSKVGTLRTEEDTGWGCATLLWNHIGSNRHQCSEYSRPKHRLLPTLSLLMSSPCLISWSISLPNFAYLFLILSLFNVWSWDLLLLLVLEAESLGLEMHIAMRCFAKSSWLCKP